MITPFDFLFFMFLIFKEVKLSSEHQVTVSAAQSDPHGVEIQPVDPSYSGREVHVEKAKPSKNKAQKANVIIEDL